MAWSLWLVALPWQSVGARPPLCHLTSYDFLWAAEDAELGGNLGQLPGQISLAPEMAQVGDFKLRSNYLEKCLYFPHHTTLGDHRDKTFYARLFKFFFPLEIPKYAKHYGL